MRLSLQTFSSLVQNMAASVQSSATQLVDLTAGSALRAVLEANASVGLWIQWVILLVLQTTRASTSAGADLDSWVADFSFARLPAAAASGTVTFARYTPAAAASIPVGSLVRTSDATQTFAVSASFANPAFSPLLNTYVLPAGAPSIDLPVVAQAAGSASNVLAGTITLLVTALQGIDTVNNASALQNGMDAEADPALRTRFQSFIDTRSRATPSAIGFAIGSIQQGLNYTLQENVDAGGAPRLGSFVVTVDDGSGMPSATLISSVQSAIDAVRPVGSTFVVQPPAIVVANISMTLSIAGIPATPPVSAAVSAAITRFAYSLPIGASLSVTKLAQVAYATNGSISNVTDIMLNGSAADITVSQSSVIKPGIVTVS